MNIKKMSYVLSIMAIVLFLLITENSFASGNTDFKVRVIHASSGSQYMDPALVDLTSELTSVFKYTSYKLLESDSLSIGFNQSKTSTLPGGRVLEIRPVEMKKGRIKLNLIIRKSGKQIFKTVVQLRNNSSITLGGPEYKGGYLLFNIFGSN